MDHMLSASGSEVRRVLARSQSGDIHASISEADGGMVRFQEDADEAAGSLADKTGLAHRCVDGSA